MLCQRRTGSEAGLRALDVSRYTTGAKPLQRKLNGIFVLNEVNHQLKSAPGRSINSAL